MPKKTVSAKLARELAAFITAGVIKAPRGDTAEEKIADMLWDLCNTDAEMKWLADEVVFGWSEWGGGRGLKELYNSKFKKHAENQVIDLGTKPPILCDRCQDMGIITERTGRANWCICDQAQKLQGEYPDLVERRNLLLQKPPRNASYRSMKPITQADIDTVLKERKDKIQ